MPGPESVLFVCLHGSAKSVVAAEYLRLLAAERGLEIEAASAGVEPYAELPRDVVSSLLADGIDVGERHPLRVDAEMMRRAGLVVSFECDLGDISPPGTKVSYWTGVPAVSDGYAEARDEIVRRLTSLLDDVLGPAIAPP